MGLGIDFGTTRTVVAVADRGNYPLVAFEDDAGDTVEWFPSVVAERAGVLRYGFDAIAAARDAGFAQVRSFKRLLAAPETRADGSVRIGGHDVGVVALLEGYLTALRHALKTRSNLPKKLRSATRFEATVATPANAFCTQRFVTLDAFRRAGFDVKAMLNEPSAAGFEYAHRHARTLNSKREHVVVYDLGGGTFDASLVHMSGVHHDVVATAGLSALGGDDFDRVLASMAAEQAGFRLDDLDDASAARLLDACRDAKERIAPTTRKITLDLTSYLGDEAPVDEITVSASAYLEACAPLVERTLTAMQSIVDRTDLAAPEPDVERPSTDVAGLYVVGGASALPTVGRLLRARFGRRVHRSPYPHAAVAIGLAIAGDSASGFILDDRFSRTFGLFRETAAGARATYDVLFARDTPLPRAGEPPRTIHRWYRPAHDVGHLRFFECSGLDEAGEPQGDLAPLEEVWFAYDPALRDEGAPLADHLVRRLHGLGEIIQETYSLDEKGLVTLAIEEPSTGYRQTTILGAR
ncbi:MAG: Hsp70 family protein [Polyangiales bacterium]